MAIRETDLVTLARLIAEARTAKGLTLNSAWKAARDVRPPGAAGEGISKSSWIKAEQKKLKIADHLYPDIERLFGWPIGSILRFLDENGPEPAVPTEPTVDERPTPSGQSLTARFGELSAEEQALVDAMIETLRKRH